MKWTIQYKMVALFSIIVFIGFSAMLIISYRMTEENMYRTIHEDMVDVKTKLDIAVNQYFLINRKRMSSNSLAVEKQALAKEIGSVVDGSVVIYKPDGQSFDYTEESRASSFNASPELAAAAKHEIAYVTYLDREQAIASLAFPLESNHTTIGILRYQRDYSELYQRNLRFQNTLEGFAVVLFIFIFAASVMISRKITRPIRELTQLSTKVSQGNLNVDIQIHAKDEIGELAGTFTAMINRIREQIDVIERERDEVTQIQARSKTFFDNVTHELKTPLTTILGYAQILKDNGFTDKVFFDKGLDYVIKESQRLNGMVVDILDMSVASTTNQTYRMKQVDLSGLVQEACEDMKVKASKYNIVIHYEVEDRMLLHGDREKLKQAFLNVMDNSIKYGHVNSIISVEAYRQHNLNIVIVRDKGNGVKEELLQRVFEPFYRGSGMAKEERGSAGLGLSIVKSTVEYHGGTIVMSSRINEGTEVTISFPGENMNKSKNVGMRKTMPNMLILSAMLLFFVCCIYGVSDLYMLSKGNSRTILLSDKQFAGKLTVPPDSTVKIESIIRQVYDFPIYLFKAIDHNSVVIISPDRSFSGNKLSMLWLEENKIKDIAGNVSYVINLLRKEKGLIYTQYGQDWDVKSAYLYDLSNSKISLYPYNAVESLLFISEDSYIGFDGESFNLLQDGGEKKRMLYSYEELSNLVAEKNDLKQSVDVQILLESLQLSYEQKDVYFLVQMNEKAVIYRFDVNKKNGITIMASGQGIEQFKVLGNGNLLLYGTIEGTKGLFMYDKNTATYKLLKEGVIWGIAVDEEQTRVAYFSGEDSKNNEIHVAYLEGNKLLYDTVIYRNLEGLPTLQWSKNDLFVSGRVINRTEFLRFTLNAW